MSAALRTGSLLETPPPWHAFGGGGVVTNPAFRTHLSGGLISIFLGHPALWASFLVTLLDLVSFSSNLSGTLVGRSFFFFLGSLLVLHLSSNNVELVKMGLIWKLSRKMFSNLIWSQRWFRICGLERLFKWRLMTCVVRKMSGTFDSQKDSFLPWKDEIPRKLRKDGFSYLARKPTFSMVSNNVFDLLTLFLDLCPWPSNLAYIQSTFIIVQNFVIISPIVQL